MQFKHVSYAVRVSKMIATGFLPDDWQEREYGGLPAYDWLIMPVEDS
tara:strand:- start:632 stop:772 length:141 start_codon:yes stop_codon:yes gene_type:complete